MGEKIAKNIDILMNSYEEYRTLCGEIENKKKLKKKIKEKLIEIDSESSVMLEHQVCCL